jgi:hypothetical protein
MADDGSVRRRMPDRHAPTPARCTPGARNHRRVAASNLADGTPGTTSFARAEGAAMQRVNGNAFVRLALASLR